MWEVGDMMGEGLALQDRENYFHLLKHGHPPEGVDATALYERVEAWERLAIMGALRRRAQGQKQPFAYQRPDEETSCIWYFGYLAMNIHDSHQRRFDEACQRGALSALLIPLRAAWAYASLLWLALQHWTGYPFSVARPLRFIAAYTAA